MASEDPAEATVYLGAWWCTVGLCIFADDLCLGVAWVDCLALPVAEGPTWPTPIGPCCRWSKTRPWTVNCCIAAERASDNISPILGCVCRQHSQTWNIFMGNMIRQQIFVFPYLQRNPAGFQLETSCHKRRFCATASAPMARPMAVSNKINWLCPETW